MISMEIRFIKNPKYEGLLITAKEGSLFLEIEEAKELYMILENYITKMWLRMIGLIKDKK